MSKASVEETSDFVSMKGIEKLFIDGIDVGICFDAKGEIGEIVESGKLETGTADRFFWRVNTGWFIGGLVCFPTDIDEEKSELIVGGKLDWSQWMVKQISHTGQSLGQPVIVLSAGHCKILWLIKETVWWHLHVSELFVLHVLLRSKTLHLKGMVARKKIIHN